MIRHPIMKANAKSRIIIKLNIFYATIWYQELFFSERLSHNRVLQTINVLLNNIHKIILKISFKDTNYIRNRPCYNQIQMLSIKGKYLVWTDVKIIKLHQ